MLGRTSHLPPASHRLSVLTMRRGLISSDMVEQEKNARRVQRKCFWLCALWLMRDVKASLSLLFSFLVKHTLFSLCDLIPFLLMQPCLSKSGLH